MNTEQLKQAAERGAPYVPIPLTPATILALLECVDALEAMLLQVPETNWTKPAFIRSRAALQKLGAL